MSEKLIASLRLIYTRDLAAKTPATSNFGVLTLGDTTKATVAVACVFAPKMSLM